MTGFSADWLRLREPFDHAAREVAAQPLGLAGLASQLRHHRPSDEPLSIMDLACGTGANLRELALRLGGRQRWQLVDHDPALLAALPAMLGEWATAQGGALNASTGGWRLTSPGFDADISLHQMDLVTGLDTLPMNTVQLVTASALLDLVSAEWLNAFAQHASRAEVALLFALNVDGQTHWRPSDPDDDAVHAAFVQHQQRDKGFGPALGPAAMRHARQVLKAARYEVREARSDWHIGPSDLQAAMIDGMGIAAREQSPEVSERIEAWQARRHALCVKGGHLTVGHLDLLAWPQDGV